MRVRPIPSLVVALLATSAAADPAQVGFGGDVAFGPASVLTLELGGLAPGTGYDRLDAAGDAALSGDLELLTIGGFAPPLGTSFTLLTCASRTGEFAGVAGVQQPGGLDLALGYGAGDAVVTVRRRGDVDGDGELTAADTAVVEAAAAAGLVTTAYGAGDVDGSGLVDAQDVAIVEDAVASAGPAPVPALGGAARLALALSLSLLGVAWLARRPEEGEPR